MVGNHNKGRQTVGLRLSKMRIVFAVVLASILLWDILVGSSFFSIHWLIQGSSQIALANAPPPPPGTLTITCLGNAGRVTATWTDAQGPHTQVFTKTLQGGNDFPATLNFPGSASVTLDASDQDGWSHICWEHTTNGQLYHEGDEEITVSVSGSVTRTALFMRAELEVYDGAGGAMVAEADESTRGAFSAANVNDTDNNGTVDKNQTTVPGEKDLIKLVLKMPEPSGKAVEHNGLCGVSVSGGADCKLWTQSTKGTEFAGGAIQLSSLPLTLWLEGRDASGSLRDVSISYVYMVGLFNAAGDGANATFLNVNLSGIDLYRTVPEAEEESIGAFIHHNIDNDDGIPPDKNPDKTQEGPITGEDDLKRAYASVSPLPNVGVVALKTGTGMKIYKSATKGATNLLVDSGGEKTWDLANANQRTQYTTDIANLFVEGTADGSSNLSLEYRLPAVLDDKVKYTFVAATCKDQPTPSERSFFKGNWPGLIHCEWSITAPASGVYNCIAWSVGETNVWYTKLLSSGQYIIGIDEVYGDHDGQFEIADMDAFYDDKGYAPTATSAADADVMYYSNFHGAAKKGCGCMPVPISVCPSGKYMFESKCGQAERIEHVHDQLNGTTYGSPIKFYKAK
jgi:hypothetical protein